MFMYTRRSVDGAGEGAFAQGPPTTTGLSMAMTSSLHLPLNNNTIQLLPVDFQMFGHSPYCTFPNVAFNILLI